MTLLQTLEAACLDNAVAVRQVDAVGDLQSLAQGLLHLVRIDEGCAHFNDALLSVTFNACRGSLNNNGCNVSEPHCRMLFAVSQQLDIVQITRAAPLTLFQAQAHIDAAVIGIEGGDDLAIQSGAHQLADR